MDGKKYTEDDTLSVYREALEEFKSENPSFIGSKCIYAPAKLTSNDTTATYFEIIRRLHTKFPQFLAGFDLVGQEDKAPTLMSYAQQILELPDTVKLFFHAGETNWYGSTDENLVIDLSFINFFSLSLSCSSVRIYSCQLLLFVDAF